MCRRYRLTGRTPPVRVTENRARPHRIVPSLGQGSPHRSVLVVRVPLSDKRPPLQGVPGMEVAAKGDVSGGAEKETGRWKSRWKIRDLLADKRCGQAVLDFLTATDVGRLVPPVEEDGAGSQTSEWELRERREQEEEQEAEAEELGAAGGAGAGEELPLFLPTPSFMASAGEE